MKNLLSEVRGAIYEVFSEDSDALLQKSLEKHVMLPDEDPGEWAPNSCAVIHNESLMIGGPTEALDRWLEVSNLLIPHGYFVEHINESVSAVYKC